MTVNQRDSFHHLNAINIKDLIVKRTILEKQSEMSPQMKAAIRINREKDLNDQTPDAYYL
jgi:hypothetical protein